MDGEATTIGGIVIPSTDPVFLAVVIGVHIPLGIACVVTGASAMLSRKGRGRHSRFGTIYFWCLLALFVSATLLSIMRWSENYHLFVLGAVAFGFAWFGRSAPCQTSACSVQLKKICHNRKPRQTVRTMIATFSFICSFLSFAP